MSLCEVHPFFGLLVKELSEMESTYAHGQDADATIVLSFANDFEAIVRDAKALIERCLDDRYQPDSAGPPPITRTSVCAMTGVCRALSLIMSTIGSPVRFRMRNPHCFE